MVFAVLIERNGAGGRARGKSSGVRERPRQVLP
jgi:hypothetical protein